MREAASDDVVQALEIVVDRYGKDIAPYAVALAQKLAEAFHAYAGEDDDEEASMAAVQCVEAMAAVLASLDDNENNVYAQLEPYLRPVLHRVFEESGEFLEYFENGIEVRSRRPAVLQCLHAIDATRVHQTRPWVVSFSILGPFGPRRGAVAACQRVRSRRWRAVDAPTRSPRRRRRDAA